METATLDILLSPIAQHSPETEGVMFESLGDGRYRFVLCVRVPGLDTPRRRVLIEPCTTDRRAEELAPVLKERVRAEFQRSLTQPIKTLKDAIEAYRRANPNAKWGDDRYRVALAWAGVLDLDRTIMIEFDNVVKLFQSTKTQYKTPPSESTVNKLIGICKAATRYCYDNYLADRDWLHGYRRIQEFNERAVYVTRETLDVVLAEMPDAPYAWKPLTLAAYFTGMRQGELRALTMSRVDLFKRRITLLTSKTGRPRLVPFDVNLEPYFKERAAAGAIMAFEICGHPLKKYETCQAWRRAARRAKLGHIRFHDLRGTFGTDLIESGVPHKVVMEIMGHFSYNTFLRYQKVKHDCQLDQALEARRCGSYEATTKRLQIAGGGA